MRRLLVIAMLLGAAGARAAPKPSPAGDEKGGAARRFYETGMLHYERGEFLDAAREFERAFGEQASPALLYNIGSAYDKAGERRKAVAAYRKYVDTMPESKDVAAARARADILDRELKELEAARSARTSEPRSLPPSLPFVEPTTRYAFETVVTVDGRPYILVGAGARKVYGFKVYAMGLYVEDEPARRAFPRLAQQAGGSDHASLVRSELAYQFVVLGEFGKLARLHFTRNVSAKETRDAYREALGEAASTKAPPELKRAAEAFLALFDDIKEGEDIIIRTTTEGQIVVEAHGQKRVGPTNLRLTHDIWDIWLGARPISGDLKKSIVDRIDTLGR